VVEEPSAEPILEVEVVDPLTDPELVGMEGERQSFDVDDDEEDYSLAGPPKRKPTDRVDDLLSQVYIACQHQDRSLPVPLMPRGYTTPGTVL
jgi:hypothetical protein